MKYLLCMGFLMGVFVVAGARTTNAQCYVSTDGGVLNVRSAPKKGRVITTLANGTAVTVLEKRDLDYGMPYFRIRAARRRATVSGWVDSAYIHCN